MKISELDKAHQLQSRRGNLTQYLSLVGNISSVVLCRERGFEFYDRKVEVAEVPFSLEIKEAVVKYFTLQLAETEENLKKLGVEI